MKKTLLKIIAAALIWAAVLILCIRFGGNGLMLFFERPPDASDVTVRFSPEGIVRVAEIKSVAESDEIALRLAAVKQGETEATVVWEGPVDETLYARELSMQIHSLPLGILTDSITWNFTGWDYMVVCLTGFCLTASMILYAASRSEQKRMCFSYRAIRYLGLAIFLFVVSFFRIGDLVRFLQGRNAGTVWSLLVGIIASAQTFMRWTAVAIGFFALIVAVSNLVLMRHEGIRASNMLGIAVAAVIVGGAALGIWLSYSRFIFQMRNVMCNVYAGLFAYFECLLAATVIRALEAGRHEPEYDKDYIIIHGCRIRSDGTLYPLIRGRVDRALAFAKAQLAATGKQAVLVPSGGKGSDEPVSEAEAMADYLRQQGIPEECILMEDKSGTTKENLRLSRDLIDRRNRGDRVAFSTSNYHVCRVGILAEEMGWNIDGMGSRTKWYFWPNAFLREFIGLMAESWLQQLTAALIIAALSAVITLIL